MMRFVDRLRTFFTLTGRPRTSVDAGEKARAEFLDPLLETLLEKATRQNARLRQSVHDVADGYWKTGQKDAHNGQRRAEFEPVARAAAELLRAEALSTYRAGKAQFNRAKEAKQRILDMAWQRFESQNHHLTALQERFEQNPRAISFLVGVIYLSTAIFLIFADIPLALKLTQVGFNLDLGTLKIRDFFFDPIDVFRDNWEVFILAVGLAFCTVYLKIFYDRHVATHGLHSPSADERTHLPGDGGSKLAWFVLGLTLVTTVLLGLFRFTTLEYAKMGSSISPGSGVGFVALFRSEPFRIGVTCLTFIFITLLFPVIGGICLSLGLNPFHNLLARNRAKRELRRAQRRYRSASTDLEKLTSTATDWDWMLEWCESQEFLETTTSLLDGSYRHGYERGWMMRLRSSFDPVMIASIMRHRVLAHLVSERVNTVAPTDRGPNGSGVARAQPASELAI